MFLVLATQAMLRDAWRFGHEGPLYMDATHGIQRYGLKVVTLHVKTNEQKGERCRAPQRAWCVALPSGPP